MDAHEVIDRLQTGWGFFDVSQVFTFEGYRETADGRNQAVHIKVSDAGPNAGELRYSVEVTSEDNKVIRGNPAGTIDEALAIAEVHLGQLD